MKQAYKVVLVEDHTLLRKGLANMVNGFPDYEVLFEVGNGNELIEALDPGNLPDLILMDINMPEMDGYSTTSWVKRHYPDVKVLALSMYDTENAVIRMFKAGARGYIVKRCEPAELKLAMDAVIAKGYHYSEMVTGRLIHTITKYEDIFDESLNPISALNDRELEFLHYACSELTYKEIASKMYLSPRTIDGYRDNIFDKLGLRSRVGLVCFAFRNGIEKT